MDLRIRRDAATGRGHPLTAKPGELVRLWIVDPGPSLDTDFHIVGTLLNTAYPFGGWIRRRRCTMQTVTVPAGRRWRLRREDRQAWPLPLRLPRFSAVDEGQVGVLNVGNVKGTMSQ